MDNQLVRFETAKLAKEKGFREYTPNCFDVERSNAICNTGVNANEFSRVGNVSAPTQSLLQKWLREKHNLHIEIYHHKLSSFNQEAGFRGLICFMDNNHESDGIHVWKDDKNMFKTYEEALEIGLIEGLKLIQ